MPAASLALPRSATCLAPGLLLTLALALPAGWLGGRLPLVGAPVFGILLGMAVKNFVLTGPACDAGAAFAASRLLKASVVALGFGLDLGQVARVGGASLGVTLATLATAFASAWLLGRWLRVGRTLRLLIGAGTAICGGSAIAAVASVIGPDEHDTTLAISVIFLFNVAAVLLFPPLGHLLGMSDAGFGLWAGTAINDTSSVVAAGYSFSQAAGDQATIVKLTRATFIIPLCLGLALTGSLHRRRDDAQPAALGRIFPWFILGFLAASALGSAGLVPAAWQAPLQHLAGFLIVLALTAIGLGANLRKLAASGPRPLLLGGAAWVAVATSSLAMQWLLSQL